MKSPYEKYQQELNQGKKADSQQKEIILKLDKLYHCLMPELQNSSLFKLKLKLNKILFLLVYFFCKKTSMPIRNNFYIYGPVGRGKTWLMDLFFDSLPVKYKYRIHFQAFMKNIHDQLQLYQGYKDPLSVIIKKLSQRIKILCLDEFFVTDIADAMILSRVFKAIFDHSIDLIITSNLAPDDLYKNGLQRSQFLPAINLIKNKMTLLTLNTVIDYRCYTFKQADIQVFFYPLNNAGLKSLFLKLASHKAIQENQIIYLYNRPVLTRYITDNIIWFDFKTICQVPRHAKDYLSIARKYKIIIIDQLSYISDKNTNIARYFIYLIDILYDAKILLILNSAVTLDNIYPKGELVFEFGRTLSRLTEMQSENYIQHCMPYNTG